LIPPHSPIRPWVRCN